MEQENAKFNFISILQIKIYNTMYVLHLIGLLSGNVLFDLPFEIKVCLSKTFRSTSSSS